MTADDSGRQDNQGWPREPLVTEPVDARTVPTNEGAPVARTGAQFAEGDVREDTVEAPAVAEFANPPPAAGTISVSGWTGRPDGGSPELFQEDEQRASRASSAVGSVVAGPHGTGPVLADGRHGARDAAMPDDPPDGAARTVTAGLLPGALAASRRQPLAATAGGPSSERIGRPERPDRPMGQATNRLSAPSRGPRHARLVLQRVEPWSVFQFSLVASLCLGLVLVVAVGSLYAVLSALGVLASVNDLLGQVFGGTGGSATGAYITAGRVLGAATVVAAVDVVLLTVLATLSALLYNLCASLTGGIDVDLRERD